MYFLVSPCPIYTPFPTRYYKLIYKILYPLSSLYRNYFIPIFYIMPLFSLRKQSKTSVRIKILFPILITGIFSHAIKFLRLFRPIPVYADASFTVITVFLCLILSVKWSPFFLSQPRGFYIIIIQLSLRDIHFSICYEITNIISLFQFSYL